MSSAALVDRSNDTAGSHCTTCRRFGRHGHAHVDACACAHTVAEATVATQQHATAATTLLGGRFPSGRVPASRSGPSVALPLAPSGPESAYPTSSIVSVYDLARTTRGSRECMHIAIQVTVSIRDTRQSFILKRVDLSTHSHTDTRQPRKKNKSSCLKAHTPAHLFELSRVKPSSSIRAASDFVARLECFRRPLHLSK